MNGLIGITGVVAILLIAGAAAALARPSQFSLRWLLAAAALVVLNDLLLTGAYGRLPVLVSGDWNWQGKALALTATLIVASSPWFGWRASGLTVRQAEGSLKTAAPVALIYLAFFLALAVVFPNEPVSAETVAFQLTMPGLEEEPFYRGVLLLALGRAFTDRARILGVEWGWGAILACVLFGLTHAFGYSDDGFHFDALVMAMTALPSLIAVWLVLRTRSLLAPIVLHNFGNAVTLMI